MFYVFLIIYSPVRFALRSTQGLQINMYFFFGPAAEAQNPSHCISREFPQICIFEFKLITLFLRKA